MIWGGHHRGSVATVEGAKAAIPLQFGVSRASHCGGCSTDAAAPDISCRELIARYAQWEIVGEPELRWPEDRPGLFKSVAGH